MIEGKDAFLPGASNADAEGALLNELNDELGATEKGELWPTEYVELGATE